MVKVCLSQSDNTITTFVSLTKKKSAADYSQTRELTPVKQLLNTHLPACFPSGKTAYVEGKKAHMANLAIREECGNIGWVATVTELCEKLSLLLGNFEFLPSSPTAERPIVSTKEMTHMRL